MGRGRGRVARGRGSSRARHHRRTRSRRRSSRVLLGRIRSPCPTRSSSPYQHHHQQQHRSPLTTRRSRPFRLCLRSRPPLSRPKPVSPQSAATTTACKQPPPRSTCLILHHFRYEAASSGMAEERLVAAWTLAVIMVGSVSPGRRSDGEVARTKHLGIQESDVWLMRPLALPCEV